MHRKKIVVVGSGTAGKTSFIHRLVHDTFQQNYKATVFDNITHHFTPTSGTYADQTFELEIWDTSGQDSYDRLRPLAYEKVDVSLICFNVADKLGFSLVEEKWLPEIRHHCVNSKLVLVGLKNDLRKELPSILVNVNAAKVLARKYSCLYLECSAMLGENVNEVMERALELSMEIDGEAANMQDYQYNSMGRGYNSMKKKIKKSANGGSCKIS